MSFGACTHQPVLLVLTSHNTRVDDLQQQLSTI